MQSKLRAGAVRPSSRSRSSVVVRADARPLWAPGVAAPAWLDGSLPGDRGARARHPDGAPKRPARVQLGVPAGGQGPAAPAPGIKALPNPPRPVAGGAQAGTHGPPHTAHWPPPAGFDPMGLGADPKALAWCVGGARGARARATPRAGA